MIYYITDEGKRYVDFHYLLGISRTNRSHLHGILTTEGISRIPYKNSYLYDIEELQESPTLFNKMEFVDESPDFLNF